MSFDVKTMVSALWIASHYIGGTLFMATVAMLLGLGIGIGIALLRFYHVAGIAGLLKAIITVLKGIPVVLVMLGGYMVMNQGFNPFAKAMGWSLRYKDVSPYWVAIFTLLLMAIVNISEIYRGAFDAVKKGQFDAATAIGFTRGQIIKKILLPQSLPTVVPMLANFFINLIKASALASMVGVMDIFQAASNAAQQNYSYLESYVAAAILYWGLSLAIDLVARLLEHRVSRKFVGTVATA